jgi:outer membrane protein TolC
MRIVVKKSIQLLVVFAILFAQQNMAQKKNMTANKKQKITLDAVLSIANKNALDAFKAKQQYGASYWQFKSFKASALPMINLDLQPLTYNKVMSKRYDSENNIDVYRPQQNLNYYGNLSINQNIQATGATVFINSSFNGLVNYGEINSKNYTATPVQIGFIQPVMAFNSFKWARQIEPLKFQQAKQSYIFQMQEINLKTVLFFFDWALANHRVELAKENTETTQRLYNIGKKRYDLGSIEKDDVLNLELDVYNAETNLTQTLKELDKSESELKLFLRDDLPLQSIPELPTLILNLQIDAVNAISLTEANNPDVFNLKIRKIEASRDLDRVIKENRFDLSLTGSYGLNQNANTIPAAYGKPLEQEMIAVQLRIPVLDWGERKGNIKTAKMNNEVSKIAILQEEDKFKQQLVLKVADFNLQKQLVSGALRSSEISKSSYEITEKRFLSGSIDLLRLSSARKAWQSASESYIVSLYNYWQFYYELQQLTLYDFQNTTTISKNFDEILDK